MRDGEAEILSRVIMSEVLPAPTFHQFTFFSSTDVTPLLCGFHLYCHFPPRGTCQNSGLLRRSSFLVPLVIPIVSVTGGLLPQLITPLRGDAVCTFLHAANQFNIASLELFSG